MMNIAAHPRYENYHDTGVEWLGNVPSAWAITRLGTVFTERRTKVSDKDYEPLSVTKNGILQQLDSAAKTNDGDNRKLVKKGDFVINSRSDRKGSSGVSPFDGSVSLINIVLQPKGIHPDFCNYVLKSFAFVEEYYRMGHGIVADLWTTRYDEMRGILMALPSPDEQRAIAAFLDDKCAKIDGAVKIKEDQIALLRERRQIIIQDAVTRGLNPAVPMKDSGIDWIGQIPAHWDLLPLKRMFFEKNERTKTGTEVLLSLRMNDGLVPHDDVSDKPLGPDDLKEYKKVIIGQLVMNRMRASIGIFGLADADGIVSPDYAIFDMKAGLDGQFFLHLFKTGLMGQQFRVSSRGLGTGSSGFMRLYTDDFGAISVAVPPSSEQREIVAYIQDKSAQINEAVALKERQIAALKEYKTSLINAAVTGKIKVI
jgi:type I restriction enzyme S subunit